jgi:hypothetical protein
MKMRSQQPSMGMTEIASRFNGWDKNAKRMRAVGTRLAPSFVAYLRGTPAAYLRLPAVKTTGYPCQMSTASALSAPELEKLESIDLFGIKKIGKTAKDCWYLEENVYLCTRLGKGEKKNEVKVRTEGLKS